MVRLVAFPRRLQPDTVGQDDFFSTFCYLAAEMQRRQNGQCENCCKAGQFAMMIKDKLRSCAAKRQMPGVEHRQHKS